MLWLAYHSFHSLIKVIIRDDLGEVYGLAVDGKVMKIYFTDFIFERIEVETLTAPSERHCLQKICIALGESL